MYPDFQTTRSTNPALPAIKEAPPTHDTLIIHHISDPHYSRGGGIHPLERYKNLVQGLPEAQRPHVLIVTGDLTLTGSREELRETALLLRGVFHDPSRQRIFVVPGPHDIDWSAANPTDSFAPLRESLSFITLPAFLDRQGNMMPGLEPYYYSTANHYLVYVVNTAQPPEVAARVLGKSPEDLFRNYRTQWKSMVKPGAFYNDNERQLFLEQTKPLIAMDLGAVSEPDIARFSRTVKSLHLDEPGSQSQPGEDLPVPLKIIVTHHPLISYIGQRAQPHYAAVRSGPLVETARHQGFQLALHGHTHEPHVFADYPMEHFMVLQNPLFQIGAGSLGAVRGVDTFNSMTALRDRTTGEWSLDLRTIKLEDPLSQAARLDDVTDYPALHFLLSNPVKRSTPTTTAVAAIPSVNSQFMTLMQVAMEQFNQDLIAGVGILPQQPLRTIEDAIKDVVFKGYEVRVSLALKQRFATTGDPRAQTGGIVLENHYISPGHQVDLLYMHPFSYPDTLAAWSLVQGEPIIYPTDIKAGGKVVDYAWLNLNGKYRLIETQFNRMSKVGSENPERGFDLFTKLSEKRLTMGDLFKPVPGNTLPADFSPHFTSFICVPVPFRPRDHRPQVVPEIGVLNIDLVDPDPQALGEAFTPERIDMLHTISDFITLVLITSHALKRPLGTFVATDA